MKILGVRIDAVQLSEAVAKITAFVESHQSHQVATVNPEFVITAQRHPEFLKAINTSSLNVPDGAGIVLVSGWYGQKLARRVTGVDLILELARVAATKGYGLFLLGAGPGVAKAAAARLQAKYPMLKISGTYEGSPQPSDEAEIIEKVKTAQPQILLVAYGAPSQDLWINRNLAKLPPCVAIGVGGSFDFISGRVRRAPVWMQKHHLEWLFRLIRQPWRLRRMLVLPYFLVMAAKEKLFG